MIEELKATYSAKERTELSLSNLEKLKAEVSVTEAQYNMLKADYTKICEDAISRINAVKTALEKDLKSTVGDLEIAKPRISNLEARFKLGLVPAETYLKQKGISNEDGAPSTVGLQLVINKAADCIEFGLDMIGEGAIFSGEKVINACAAILKVVTRKR
jgi:hypothetical protein